MSEPDPRPEHTPCSDWPSRLDVRGPDHFLELVNELKAATERDELDVLHASHPFDAVMQDGEARAIGEHLPRKRQASDVGPAVAVGDAQFE